MQTREIPYPRHCGCDDVVIRQELRNGHWTDIGIRKISTTMSEHHTPPAGASGSHNGHSRLSPSSAKQWLNCSASIGYIKSVEDRLPADDSSEYSREGTTAHDLAAAVFNNQMSILDVPEDFRPHVHAYVDHCLSSTPDDSHRMIEQKIPLFYMPPETGTADFVAVTEERVWIRDLKYGAGVLVISEENEQLGIYALSVIRDLQADGIYEFSPATIIDIMAFQPRHREAQDAKPWVLTLADLEAFCEPIQAKAELILSGGEVEFSPGEDTCRWCRAKALCGARAAAMADAFDGPECAGIDYLAMLPDLTKPEKKLPVKDRVYAALSGADFDGGGGGNLLAALDDAKLVAIYARSKAIRSFLDDVEEHLEALALQGRPVKGTKLVSGREGNRAWGDEDAADKWLQNQGLKQDERYDFKLKSPTKIEEALKDKLAKVTKTKNKFDSLVTRSAAKPVLALESDKREAVSAAVDLLPDVSGGDEMDGV